MKWVYLALLIITGLRVVGLVRPFRRETVKRQLILLTYELLVLLLLLPIVREYFGIAREEVVNHYWLWLGPVVFLGPEIVARICGYEGPLHEMWRTRNDPVWEPRPKKHAIAPDDASNVPGSESRP